MKFARVIILSVVLAGFGCTDKSPSGTPTTRADLRKILATEFVPTSIPKEKEDDFYLVLAAFAEKRRSYEFVRSVDFRSESEASLSYLDGGIHGGGHATLKKVGGKWIMGDRESIM